MTRQNQHWVPQFLLRNFVASDGLIFRFDKSNDRVERRPTKKVASEIGFNNFPMANSGKTFEQVCESVETRAAPILKSLIRNRNSKSLTQSAKISVAEFIYLQTIRTEAFHRGLIRSSTRNEIADTINQLYQLRDFNVHDVERRHWILMENTTDQKFFLGDNPVTFQNSENPKSNSALGFALPGIEVYLPLSPDMALYLPSRDISDEIIKGYQNAHSIHRDIRSEILNGQPSIFSSSSFLRLSQRVILQAGKIYNSIRYGSVLEARDENVENFNYLQVSWASTSVFSKYDNFEFAKRLLFEVPDYRGFPKSSILKFHTDHS